jgi:hypothetical protein
MYKLYSVTLFIFLLISISLSAQPGAVTLKDGGGSSIGSFNSISLAYAAIPGTVSQAYFIELNNNYDGSAESYPIVLTQKVGASSTNTITIRPEASVVSVSITSSQNSIALLSLEGADFIRIDGRPGGSGTTRALLISNMGTTTSSYGIEFVNGAGNNIVQHCRISGYTTTSSGGKGIYIGASTDPMGNSDNRFEFLTFDNGPRYFMNCSGTAANPNRNLMVYGCEFKNINFCGWWQQNGTGKVTVDSCFFYGTGAGGTTGTGLFPILSDFQTDTIIVTRNHIYNIDNFSNTTDVIGIALRSFNVGSVVRIINNFISLTAPNPTVDELFGIEFGTNNANNPFDAQVYHNTILLTGTASGGTSGNVGSAAISVSNSDALAKIDVRNNIFINQRTGGNEQQLAVSRISTLGSNTWDYNDYVSGTSDFARIGAIVYSDLNSYKLADAPNEQNSINEMLSFVSLTDLHLAAPSIGNINLYALPIAGVTLDYDGELRIHHYMGADEPDEPVGISDIKSVSDGIYLYPNPATHSFMIRSEKSALHSIAIFNAQGQLLQEIEPKTVQEFLVHTNNWADGIYFVKVNSMDGPTRNKRILIN